MTWTPDKHPRDKSGRWAAAQTFAEAANAHIDSEEAKAVRAGRIFVRRARQEYANLRQGKHQGSDPDEDGRTEDAKTAIVHAVSDTIPGPLLDAFAGDPADAVAEYMAAHNPGDPVPDKVWAGGVAEVKELAVMNAHDEGLKAVPAKYHGFIGKHEDAIASHLLEHGKIDARKAFSKSMALTKDMTDSPFILSCSTTDRFKTSRTDRLKVGNADVPVYYLEKEVIPIGDTRTHPDKGYKIHVTPERADGWIQTFGLMSERGHRVPAPPTHRDTSKSMGQWVGFTRKANGRGGESLYGELMVIGDRTLEDVLNAGDVSILTRAGLKDDKGNEYAEAIEHVSVTPYPALTKLGGWTSIAASRGGEAEKAPVFEMGDESEPVEPPAPVVVPIPGLSRATLELASKAAGVSLRSRCAAMLALGGATLALESDGGGHWVTIDGEHVLIGKGGSITKGPPSMVGKKPSELGHDGKPDGTDQKAAAAAHEAKHGNESGAATSNSEDARKAARESFQKAWQKAYGGQSDTERAKTVLDQRNAELKAQPEHKQLTSEEAKNIAKMTDAQLAEHNRTFAPQSHAGKESAAIEQAKRDWASGKAFVRNGNYYLKGTEVKPGHPVPANREPSRIAPWNKAAKARFKDSMALHEAATHRQSA